MAPRSLERLDHDIAAAQAAGAVAEVLGSLLTPVDRVAVISGAASGERALTVSATKAVMGPLLRWSERLRGS